MGLVLTQHVGIGHDSRVIGIGRGTVGDKPRLSIIGGCKGANLVGDRLAVIFIVFTGECNDVSLFQCGGIHLFDQHQIASTEIRGGHRVRQNDEHLVSEQFPVTAVEGQHRYHREQHDTNRQHCQ